MRKLITTTLILIGVLLSQCTNKAFKTVATTVNPTEKQKGLLAIACTAQFGKSEPIFGKGETKTDTLNIYSTDTVLITKNDTVEITVTNTVKTIVNNNRTDTIREGNKAREWLLESQIRDKDNIISNLKNEVEKKVEKISELRRNGAILLGLLILVLLYEFAKIIIKVRTKLPI